MAADVTHRSVRVTVARHPHISQPQGVSWFGKDGVYSSSWRAAVLWPSETRSSFSWFRSDLGQRIPKLDVDAVEWATVLSGHEVEALFERRERCLWRHGPLTRLGWVGVVQRGEIHGWIYLTETEGPLGEDQADVPEGSGSLWWKWMIGEVIHVDDATKKPAPSWMLRKPGLWVQLLQRQSPPETRRRIWATRTAEDEDADGDAQPFGRRPVSRRQLKKWLSMWDDTPPSRGT